LTTPHQRTRAALQTRDFLCQLSSPDAWPDIPSYVKDEVRRLLRHYPEAWHLTKLHDRIPEDWGSPGAVRDEMAGLTRGLTGPS
jgi:hypothetical protein